MKYTFDNMIKKKSDLEHLIFIIMIYHMCVCD